MNCPGCSGEMTVENHRGVQLDLCATCPAVWFDWGELEAYHENGGPSCLDGLPGASARFEYSGDGTRIKCPGCERDLLRTGTVGKHKVTRCTSCGGLFLPLVDPTAGSGGVLKAAVRVFQEIFTSRE